MVSVVHLNARIFKRTKIRQVPCKRSPNQHKPKPTAVTLLQLQSRHSTGENAYIDFVICPEGERVKNKLTYFHANPIQLGIVTKQSKLRVKRTNRSHFLFVNLQRCQRANQKLLLDVNRQFIVFYFHLY